MTLASLLASTLLGSSGAAAAAAWLAIGLTYSLHAAIWCAAAALLARLRSLSPSSQHLLWKLALFAPLATTGLALLLRSSVGHAVGAAGSVLEGATLYLSDAARASTTAPVEAPQRGAAGFGWSLLAACGGAASALGLLRFAGSMLALRARLQERTRVRDTRLLQRLERLRVQVALPPIALSQSQRVTSPLVIGSSEICVPEALLATLDDAELDSVLAHELAHLERGDGLWFPLAGLLQCTLWLQPLNHLVAARFRHCAELACDDRAVELTAQPLPLARALIRLADSALSARWRRALPSMAGSASTLVLRVRRLANASAPAPADSRGQRAAALLLGAIGLAAAGLAVEGARARPDPLQPGLGAAQPDASAPTAPDTAAAHHELEQLLWREQAIQRQLASALSDPEAEHEGSPAAVRVLELQQELHHVRASQISTEERFVEAWAHWEQRR